MRSLFHMTFSLLAVFCCTSLMVADQTVSAAEPVRVVMIGDSTMATYLKRPEDRPDLTGWGQVFGEFFNQDVQILNHASSGRSSKSFLTEGRWTKALADKPDYVFIQFGHNDSPGKGERYSDPETEFRDNLRKYVSESRAAGARPILVTPVARRVLKEGKVVDNLKPYVTAVLIVAEETQTPVVNLNALSTALFEELGEDGGADLNPKPDDKSHFSGKGARLISGLVASQLPVVEPELAKSLKKQE